MAFLENSDAFVRASAFILVFLIMALAEYFFPRREKVLSKTKRWITNWSLVVIDTLVLRFTMPFIMAGMAVGAAHIAQTKQWGLFVWIDLPFWLEGILVFLLLDFIIYLQHVATHYVPILWRLHKVHHADRDIDVTSGFRFHPIEILFSMVFKVICVIALGAPVWVVFLFEIILNAGAMFNHANVKLPLGLDKIVRFLIVTPDMHRVHHSTLPQETNSNFGFFLSIWDRLFKTYIPQPQAGHDEMTIGLNEYQDAAPAKLSWSLKLPFIK